MVSQLKVLRYLKVLRRRFYKWAVLKGHILCAFEFKRREPKIVLPG